MPSRNASEKFPRVGVSVFLAFVSWIAGLSGTVFAAVPMQQSMPPALSAGIGRTAPRTITVGKSGAYDYSTIQAAIDAATTGDTVLVYPATYIENINFNGKNIILRSTNPTDSATVAATIIDGNSSGSVVTFAGSETAGCVLSGFTIQNGHATADGGGISGHSTRATIRDNVIAGNRAWHGGGIYGCAGLIEYNKIIGNVSDSPWEGGGGLAVCGGTIQHNTIANNSSWGFGGAIWAGGVIQHNTIVGNSASYGGAISGAGVIQHNTIVGNSAFSRGGAICYGSGTIRNNTIVGNWADLEGGGLYYCDGPILSNTFVGNAPSALSNCYARILNCIIWANGITDSAAPSFSCIQGWTGGGVGNISADPLFTTGPLGPYYLSQVAAGQSVQSPCVDAGSALAVAVGLADCTTRSDGVLDTGTVDMGYHYPGAVPLGPIIVTSPTAFSLTLSLGATTRTRTLEIWNGGSRTLQYQVAGVPATLIDVSPTWGQSSWETWRVRHSVTFKTAGLSLGIHSGQIVVTADEVSSPVVIPVTIAVVLVQPPRSLGLDWSTYLGGSGPDEGHGIGTDRQGNVCVTGRTASRDFPTSGGSQRSYGGGQWDCFVAKFSADGAFRWSTDLGGTDDDYGHNIATDPVGNIYVAGLTNSPDFPTTRGFDTRYNGGYDVFVTKLSPAGVLLWSTFLGGSGFEYDADVAVDGAGNVYVGGMTGSQDFPTSGGYDTTYNGGNDAFVAKFNTNGQLLWSTLLGGSWQDMCYGLTVDDAANVYVTGVTGSLDLPTPHAYDNSFNGGVDVFLAKFSSSGNLIWCTYFGGGGWEYGRKVAAYQADSVYLFGYTQSLDFPTSGGWDRTYNGGQWDCFIAKFSAGGALRWSTYLGGSDTETCDGIATDGVGDVLVGGSTLSSNFPVVGGGKGPIGGADAFMARFNPNGSLVWSTYFGGSSTESGPDLAVDDFGDFYVTGFTMSDDFPTSGGYDITYNGNTDVYVAKFRPVPTTTEPLIAVTPTRFDVSVPAGTQPATTTLWVWNRGAGTLQYVIDTTPTQLIAVSPRSGQSVNGQRVAHSVVFRTAQLPAGTYAGHMTITGNAPNSPAIIPVTIRVVPAPPPEPFHTAWSTYLGGSGTDGANSCLTDLEGNIFMTAYTESADFPTTAGGPVTRRGADIAISKFSRDGALLWTKFLAGNGSDSCLEIAADSHGNLFLTGFTWSTDFATPGAYDTTYNGGGSLWGDGFVAKLSPKGDRIWATYLGGSGQDYGWGIAVDSAGNVYVTGMTDSRDFPVVGSQSRGPNGDRDSFVAKLSADGRRLLWSTYLGGHGEDLGYRVTLDNAGGVYVGGRTTSRDFPTTGIHSASFRGGSFDGYVTKFSADGRLLWSTCLGGSGDEGVADVLWDRHGHVYATGGTTSADFPGLGSSDSTLHGNSDAFITKFSADGLLLRSALFGGSGMDAGGELALDAAGNLCLAGVAGSPGFPVEGGVGFAGGSSDVFVMGFDGNDTLVRSTCLGGHGSDLPRGLATDTAGGVIVAGQTSSTDFPTTRAWQPTYGGGAWDGFITKFGGVPATTQPLIAVIPVRFDLSVTEGIRPATATLWAWNRGVGTLRYQIRAPNVMPAIFPPLNFGMQVTPSTGQSSGLRVTHRVAFLEVEHLLPGTYTQNIVISGNATNSPTTVPVRITINPRPPSLVVSPTRFDVAVTAGQQSTTRTLQVRNGGGGTLAYTVATSPSWLISVQPPSGTATGTANHHVVTFATRGLAPGTYSGRLTVAATMPPLTVFVPAVVTVNAPLLPNLTVSHVDVAPKAPVQVHPGDRIALSAFLENAGAANAGPFWTEVWGSKTGGLTLDRVLVPSLRLTGGLSAGGSYSWVVSAPLASIPDGRYTVVYAVDRLGQVAESYERDNRAVVRAKSILVVRPQTQIDLAVEGFGLSPNPAQSGGLIRFAGQVINRGTQASGPFWIEFWGSRDWPYPSLSFPLCASLLVQNLAPGARVDLSTLSRRLYNVPTGVFMAGCVADRQDSVNEANKTNNYRFVDGQVFNHSTLIARPPDERAVAGSDIAVRSADFSPAAPSQLASGSTLTLTVELANPGSLNTGPFWLEYWGSLDGGLTLKNLLVDSARITNIAPGQTVRLSGRKALGRMADGLYTIVVVADRLKQVSETNEGNNRRAIAGKRLLVVRPQTGANLVVEQFRFLIPYWPRVEPNGVVRNTGTANSGSFWVEFWACPGDADYPTPVWAVCPAMRVENLAPGGSLNLLAYRPSAYNSLPAGLGTILCIVDRTDQAVETDETDNYQMVRRVTIPPH